MSAAHQRVLRACGCTGGGSSPNAVQRHTLRSLIDNRRATSRTVSKAGAITRVESMSDPKKKSLLREDRVGSILADHFEDTVQLFMLQEKKNQFGADGANWHELAENGTIKTT